MFPEQDTRALVALLHENRSDGACEPNDEADPEGPKLARFLAEAAEAWPDWRLDPSGFVPYLAQRLPPGQPCAPALGRLRAGDLYLAWACCQKISAAVAAFESHYLAEMEAVIRHAQLPRIEPAEVLQRLREKLLVGDGGSGSPRLEAYAGRGGLKAWLRVVAVREALMMVRRQRLEEPATAQRLAHYLEQENDPELGYLKQLYRERLRDAFQAAVEQLPDRDRSLLRYHYLEGLSLKRLAKLYGVHTATISRWIGKTREKLLADTLEILRAQLPVSEAEFRSLLLLLRSQLDISVRRLFDED